MPQPDQMRLREVFDEAAELYDRARPGYPAALFSELAERGCEIVCVELGASLAAVARRKLARFRSVRVEVGTFEAWPLPPEPFDTVLAATAFHWIDPAVRVTKAARALRRGGALATIATHHIAGGDAAFFAEVQACYEHWDPATPPGLRLPTADEIPFDSQALVGSGQFGPAPFRAASGTCVNAGIKVGQLVELSRDKTGTAEPASDRPE